MSRSSLTPPPPSGSRRARSPRLPPPRPSRVTSSSRLHPLPRRRLLLRPLPRLLPSLLPRLLLRLLLRLFLRLLLRRRRLSPAPSLRSTRLRLPLPPRPLPTQLPRRPLPSPASSPPQVMVVASSIKATSRTTPSAWAHAATTTQARITPRILSPSLGAFTQQWLERTFAIRLSPSRPTARVL